MFCAHFRSQLGQTDPLRMAYHIHCTPPWPSLTIQTATPGCYLWIASWNLISLYYPIAARSGTQYYPVQPDFRTNRTQHVQIGRNTFSSLNCWAVFWARCDTPCSCRTVWSDTAPFIKFADDATIVGLITNNDETACREEVRILMEWKKDAVHSPISLRWDALERVSSFMFLGVILVVSEQNTWS